MYTASQLTWNMLGDQGKTPFRYFIQVRLQRRDSSGICFHLPPNICNLREASRHYSHGWLLTLYLAWQVTKSSLGGETEQPYPDSIFLPCQMEKCQEISFGNVHQTIEGIMLWLLNRANNASQFYTTS